MSACGVCLSHVVGHSEFYNSETRRARKQHKCCECRRSIAPGDEYTVSSGKYEGEDMEAYVFPEMTTGCLEKLATASAKRYLMERWREWKGLTQ